MNTINSSGNNNIVYKGAMQNNRMAKIISRMTKADALAPVIALETTVVGGRTYQAYKRGKWDEARERFIEELMGSITWLGGVLLLNNIGDKIINRILKTNGKNFDVGTDKVLRTPFENFMKKVAPKKFSANQVAGMKSAKVITSIILANAFIGFVVPKLNQALTRKIRHERKLHNNIPNQQPSFKGSMGAINAFTNIIENTNAGKLLSTDVGVLSGRMYNARKKEERREIAIRDGGSIYFYMWACGHIGNLLNLIESGKATRLNPSTARILDNHLQDFLEKNGNSMTVDEFRRAVLGKKNSEINLPDGIVFEKEPLSAYGKMVKKQPLEVIELSKLSQYNINSEILERAKEMSKLQPERQGSAVLTKQQVIDSFNKAEINNPKLLQNVFSEFTGGKLKNAANSEFEYVGGKYIDEYGFISNKKLYKLKAQMEQYVDTICKKAKDGKVDKALLDKIRNKNIMFNGINFAAGFTVSAMFLSTFIPKIQYYVTRKTTGVDAFPGTYNYEKHCEDDD